MLNNKTAIVIGSGLSGLAAAIRLAVKGCRVKVFDANAYPGGKITETGGKGYRFDAGPSLFTMPQLVDELFSLAGKNPEEYFSYQRKEVACRYFWEDGTQLTAWGDAEEFAREAAEKTGVDHQAVTDYLRQAGETFEATQSIFLENSLHKLSNYFNKNVLNALMKMHKLHLTSTLNEVNQRKLKEPKMVQLFNRFATYNGSSPYLTPGVMSLIPHLEHKLGTYYPKGGIHAITKSLYRLAQELGAEFHFEERVEEILLKNDGGKQARGVRTAKGKYPAELVFTNMDVVPTYRRLLPDEPAPEKTLNQPRSSSALIFYWGIRKEFPQLDLHNIFFSDNYEEEFRHIFEKGEVHSDPTVYVNITSKQDSVDAPEGCENWFVMLNVPPNTGQDWDKLISEGRRNALAKLNRILKTDLEPLIEYEESLDPRDIESRTSSYQGALYGASSNNTMAAFLRHPNFTKKIKGLYFCGGSVHPGGGIPLCLLSAKIATELAD